MSVNDCGMKLFKHVILRQSVWWTRRISHLAEEITLLLLDSGLIPHRDLQHAFPEVPPVNMGVNEGLVPLGLGALLYRFGPPFTFITRTKTWTHGIGLAVILTGFLQKNKSVRWTSGSAALDWVGASLMSNHKYRTCFIFPIPCQVASDGRPSGTEQTGRHQQAYAACFYSGHLLQRLYRLLNQESTLTLILLSCSSAQNKTQARTASSSFVIFVFLLKYSLITCLCGITATNGRRVVACSGQIFHCVCSEGYSVGSWGLPNFGETGQDLTAVWSELDSKLFNVKIPQW